MGRRVAPRVVTVSAERGLSHCCDRTLSVGAPNYERFECSLWMFEHFTQSFYVVQAQLNAELLEVT